jgi:hypothetical protein
MENETTLLDLITVYFGVEETQARPFDFSKDSNGDLVKALKASTSCPYCGHGQEVNLEGWYGGAIGVKCKECGAGEDFFVEQPDNLDANFATIEINKSNIQSEIEAELKDDEINTGKSIVINATKSIKIDESKEVQTLMANCSFIDPIELGLMEIEKV